MKEEKSNIKKIKISDEKYINCLIYNHGGIILNSVAAIIITYNVENDFRLRINKLKRKVDEIIVVDNGSTNGNN